MTQNWNRQYEVSNVSNSPHPSKRCPLPLIFSPSSHQCSIPQVSMTPSIRSPSLLVTSWYFVQVNLPFPCVMYSTLLVASLLLMLSFIHLPYSPHQTIQDWPCTLAIWFARCAHWQKLWLFVIALSTHQPPPFFSLLTARPLPARAWSPLFYIY